MQEAIKHAEGFCCLPGITEIALIALNTRNVRRAETLPRFTNSVTYLQGNLKLLCNIETI